MADPTLLAAGVATVAGLLACSAFFSSTETAMFSLSPDTLERDTDDPRVAAVRALREDPHRLLVTLLVGNNVVNIAIASVVTVLVATVLPPGPAILATTALTSTVVLLFGEIIPKSYGLANAETWAARTVPAVRVVELGLWPVIVVFEAITRRASAALGTSVDIERPYLE